MHVKLGDSADGTVLQAAARRAVQRDVLCDRTVGDDHTGGVRAGVAHRAFKFGRRVDQILHVRRRTVGFFEGSYVLQHALDVHGLARDVGDEFGHSVDLGQWDIQHPAHVADGGPGPKGAEGDDLGHFVMPVLIGRILQHDVAFVILEVQVDVWHRHTARIEEALEYQPVLQGVDQRDVKTVGNDRPSRRAPCVIPNALVACVTAKIPHDQKIGIEPHFVDDAQLIVKPFTDGGLLRS